MALYNKEVGSSSSGLESSYFRLHFSFKSKDLNNMYFKTPHQINGFVRDHGISIAIILEIPILHETPSKYSQVPLKRGQIL